MFLQSIEQQDVFHTNIPARPMGKYAHIVTLRETNSFSLFQTDGELNFARVSVGRDDKDKESEIVSRVVLFKRKQTTPERLTGRELLRRYNLISEKEADDALRYCEYNSERFCKHCPDCIYYGFAIGQEGSERSKVLVDSAFSLSKFDESHQAMTFNAPYEHGTMSQYASTKSSFGEQDHVLPQIFFPSVVTIHDPTEAGFIYVLNNLLRTKRYGAQTTRTGALENHLIAVIFTDGEIFSNLKLTQTLYDLVKEKEKGPYQASELIQKIETTLPTLLEEDLVTTHLLLSGQSLKTLLSEVTTLLTKEQTLVQVLQQAYSECEEYSITYGAGAGAAKKAAQEANKKNKAAKSGK